MPSTSRVKFRAKRGSITSGTYNNDVHGAWVLLNEFARSGAIGRGPGSFSGYPELVVDSRNIASAVEAIFFPAATRLENVSAVIACRVQRTFVRELRRSACEVPVLRLHPERTEQPFEDWTEQCAQTAAAVSPRQA